MAAFLFWTCLAGLAMTYVGYPALMAFLGRTPSTALPDRKDRDSLPAVTVVIAARDEALVIGDKLESVLSQSYPMDRLDVVIASDGSTDDTVGVAGRAGGARLRVVSLENSVGKAMALNAAMAEVTAPIVVLTDARQHLAPDAVARLVARFDDPEVGAVSGDLHYDTTDERGMRRALHRYWEYEKRIRLGESRIHSCVGATGALYAIRTHLWRDLPVGTLLDDVFTPMQIVLSGHRVVFEPLAWAHDEASDGEDREYRRRVRTLTGNYQLMLALPDLLIPVRNPVWTQFVLHKLGRLASPAMLAGLLVGSFFAVGAFYRTAFWLQVGFWLFALLSSLSGSRLRFARPLALPYAFAMTQSAALLAFFHFLRRDWNVWADRR